MIIKMMLHTLHYLIILMTFSCDKYHIARLCHHAGCADSFPPVHNAQHSTAFLVGETCQHIVYDFLWVFEAGIVTCDDYTVAVSHGLLCHQRTLAFVTVATGTTHGPALSSVFSFIVLSTFTSASGV